MMKELLSYLLTDQATEDIKNIVFIDFTTGECIVDQDKLKELTIKEPSTDILYPSILSTGKRYLDAGLSYIDNYKLLKNSRLFIPYSDTMLSSYVEMLAFNRRTPVVFNVYVDVEKRLVLTNKNSNLIADLAYLHVTDENMTARFTEMLGLNIKETYNEEKSWLDHYDYGAYVFDLPYTKFNPFVFFVCCHQAISDTKVIPEDKEWIYIDLLPSDNPLTKKIAEIINKNFI